MVPLRNWNNASVECKEVNNSDVLWCSVFQCYFLNWFLSMTTLKNTAKPLQKHSITKHYQSLIENDSDCFKGKQCPNLLVYFIIGTFILQTVPKIEDPLCSEFLIATYIDVFTPDWFRTECHSSLVSFPSPFLSALLKYFLTSIRRLSSAFSPPSPCQNI